MSKKDDYLDSLFFALSDRTRRGVLEHLSTSEASVSDLAQIYSMTLAGMIKHLNLLEKAELVRLEKSGRVRVCNFNPSGLVNAEKFVIKYQKFWSKKFDDIEVFLKKT